MRVRIADLKANLSKHVRRVRETGDRIEVCVREDPVAYLVALGTSLSNAETDRRNEAVRENLRAAGLEWVAGGDACPSSLPSITPSVAGDGRTDVRTITDERRTRAW